MESRVIRRRKVQLCYPFSKSRLLNDGRFKSCWISPYVVQPKLNGERCRILVYPGQQRCLLFSSTDELITTLPHINQEMLFFPPGEYDGELYVHGWSFSEIHSVISTKTSLHPKMNFMQLHLFDLISLNGEMKDKSPLAIRLKNLINIYDAVYKLDGAIKLVQSSIASNYSELIHHYDNYISNGYEGFVVKDLNSAYIKKDPAYRNPLWMKFKPKQQDVYIIKRVNEAISKEGNPKNMVGSFTCTDPEGNEFDVGAGKLTHKEREEIWNAQFTWTEKEYSLLIEFQTLSDAKKVPHFSRAVKVIRSDDRRKYESDH